jgi:uncharacterized membrane protein
LDQHIIASESRTTHGRAIAKAITWRGIGSFDTFLLGWLITGNAAMGGSIAVLELVTKMALYYAHERAWSRVLWGVKTPAAPANERSSDAQDRHHESGEAGRVRVSSPVS